MSNHWPTTTVGEIFDISAGKAMTPAARHGEKQHPFLRTANVFWGRVDLNEVDSMHLTDEELAAKSLLKGDLLVCEGGDIGRSAIWNGEISDCSFQNHIHRLRPKADDVLPRFFMYFLQAGFTQLGIYEGAGNKTTIPNLSRNRLAALDVPKPYKLDQEKIAAILWKVQRTIETEEKLIATVRELKQSAMRQLYTQGLRGEAQKETEGAVIPQSWSLERLDRCCNVVSSSVSYTDFAGILEATEGDKVLAMGIKVSDMNLPGNESQIVRANLQKSVSLSFAERKLVPPNTVVFPKRGAAIATNKKRMTTAWTVLDPNLIGVQAGEGVDSDFLFYWFQKFDLRTITEPGPTPQLNKKNLIPLLLPIPEDLNEQAEIASILKAVDAKLSVHQRMRKTLQELFDSFLNQLMTGEIRVADLDIDVTEIQS